MKYIKLLLLFIIISFSTFGCSNYKKIEKNTHKQAAFSLLEVMEMNKNIDIEIEKIFNQILATDSNATEYINEMNNFWNSYLAFDKLKDEYALTLMDKFSEEELKELIVTINDSSKKKTKKLVYGLIQTVIFNKILEHKEEYHDILNKRKDNKIPKN